MALTINAVPNNIDNSGKFDVTTDWVENSSHVNLRIRAEVTVAAVIVATVEKPKGLKDFDLADILKSCVTGITFARDSGALYNVSGGTALVTYTVTFTEVWEDATGATIEDDDDTTASLQFVPAIGDGLAFSNYVLTDSTSRFANKTLRDNVCKFYTVNPLEYWIVFFTEVANLELFYSKDNATFDHATHFTCTDGWGVIIVNIGELMSGVTSNLRLQLGEAGGAKISEILTIYIDNSQIDERVVLEFDGIIGGKEYLAFEGIKDVQYATIRNYFTGAKKGRKPLSFTGLNRQKLETLFKDIPNALYLKSLLISELVSKMEANYVDPTPATIITDTVKISNSALFTNQLEIEYED
jgi:hypothetical protein